MFGQRPHLPLKYAFLGTYRPAGSFGFLLVNGCWARAVSPKTPVYFIVYYDVYIQGVSKKMSFIELSILRFVTNIMSISS